MSYPRFLVVDDVAENRLMIGRTLLKRFPNALLLECQDATTAATVAAVEHPTAVVAHRAVDIDGETLVAFIRHGNPTVFIVQMSGRRSTPAAAHEGPTVVISWDAWQTTAPVIADFLRQRQNSPPPA